ncbi:MAG: thioredoxin reductase [Pseudanabaenales cyanobacterium]|nr:thioredoxin reductase [Pseudanabaenales cyanobacterium]
MADVVVVGFGFSAAPLIRELISTGTNFRIISAEGDSVWDRLNKSGKLDFDLVSSYLTSFYSFDLVDEFQADYYPCATQYYEMHQKWRKRYGDRIIQDVVTRVDNFADHSVVHTQSGATINARHVVFATGFSRAIFSHIASTDYNAPNKTFVFDTMGDSANLMISHLIPHYAKVIIRTNGFHPRDKVVPAFETTHTLDQLEFQNFRYVSNRHYASIVYGATAGTGTPILIGDQFPASLRDESWNTSESRPASGAVAIKYWPIDEYCRNFGDNLPEAFSKGYFLNDICMWLHTGRAIVVPKDTPIDFEKKTITYAGIERAFDHYIKGDVETPRLPPIMVEGETPYQYHYRDNFMGVIPKTLHNIYMLGYTRPYSGGLANIIEMQGLFVHKLVTQPAFHHHIHRNLDDRIAGYIEHYFGDSMPRRYDHLVYYGFYTDDVARLIGIDYKPQDCKSLRDLMFYYAFPNNAFKYRLKGEYAVEGVAGLIRKVNRQFKGFIVSFAYLLHCSIKDPSLRAEWLHTAKRHFFNDMRHKEPYRQFLENYIRAYHQFKKVHIEPVEDPEWNALAASARQTRDEAVSRLTVPSHYQMDEDIANEIKLIQSWLNDDQGLDKLRLDPKRASVFASMADPPDYEMPFLR